MKTRPQKRRNPTPEEIENDPSLRYYPYRTGEQLYVDALGGLVRFLRYDGRGKIRVATMDGITEIKGCAYEPLKVRRPG